MHSFAEFIAETEKTGCTCWTGYKRKPGTKLVQTVLVLKKQRLMPKDISPLLVV